MNKINDKCKTLVHPLKNYKKLYDTQLQRNDILLFCLEQNKKNYMNYHYFLKQKKER